MFKNSYGEKSFRGTGRGQRDRRPTPYGRHEIGDSDPTIPRPMPDHMLADATTTEQAIERAKDDAQFDRDWKTWYVKLFER